MDCRIEAMNAANRAGAVEALCAAFMNDPLFLYAIPDTRHRARWLPHLVGELAAQTQRFGHCRAAIGADGAIVAAMLAGPYPPTSLERMRMTARLALLPAPWVPPIAHLRRFEPYGHAWHAMHVKGAHLYVHMLGVRPGAQGRGIGRRLMATLFDSSLPIYLETQTERNVPFYASMGFAVTDERHPHPDGPNTWGMIRPPH